MSGPCPVHGGKRSNTAFSYANDGKWHCFSCNEKGRGAIDLAIKVRSFGFQAAVALLEPFATAERTSTRNRGQPPRQAPAESDSAIPKSLLPPCNPPFNGASYSKFAVPSAWQESRGLAPSTLQRFGAFQYDNPARKSAYNGKILLPVRRFNDGELVA